MTAAQRMTDHQAIRQWAEERGGRPSRVKGTESGRQGEGILRLDFGEQDDSLEEISWDEFFRIFDDRKLALLIPEDKGSDSRFNKFVSRNGH